MKIHKNKFPSSAVKYLIMCRIIHILILCVFMTTSVTSGYSRSHDNSSLYDVTRVTSGYSRSHDNSSLPLYNVKLLDMLGLYGLKSDTYLYLYEGKYVSPTLCIYVNLPAHDHAYLPIHPSHSTLYFC